MKILDGGEREIRLEGSPADVLPDPEIRTLPSEEGRLLELQLPLLNPSPSIDRLRVSGRRREEEDVMLPPLTAVRARQKKDLTSEELRDLFRGLESELESQMITEGSTETAGGGIPPMEITIPEFIILCCIISLVRDKNPQALAAAE